MADKNTAPDLDAFLADDGAKAPAAAPDLDAFLADDKKPDVPAAESGVGGGSATDEGESTPKAKKATTSQLMAAVRGTASGETGGLADEMYGLVGAGINPTGSKKEFWDRFRDSRDYARGADKRAKAEYPGTYKGTEIGGAIGSAVVLPGMNTVKGATATGAVTGLGNSEADLTKGQYGKAAGDTAKGAGIGLGAGVLFGGLGKLISGDAAAGANASAENNAARALGFTKAMRNKMGNDAATDAGRVALDNDVITPLASTEDKLAAMEALREKSGGQIGDVIKSLDEKGLKEFNPADAAAEMNSKLGSKYADEPLYKSQAEQYQNLLDTVLKRGSEPIPFSEGQKLKGLIGDYGWREGMAVPGREQAQQAYGIINNNLDQAVGRAAQKTGDAGLLQRLQDARKTYGATQNAVPALENRVASEAGNKPFGLTDTILVAPKIATNPAKAALELGVKKGAERYGSNMAALTMDKVAKVLQVAPDLLGPYAKILGEAAARGGGALAAAHRALLANDSKYRQQLEAIQGK